MTTVGETAEKAGVNIRSSDLTDRITAPQPPIHWSLFHVVPVPLVITDQSGVVVFCNQAFFRELEHPAETEVVGKKLCALLHCRDVPKDGENSTNCSHCPVTGGKKHGLVASGVTDCEIQIHANDFPWAGEVFRILTLSIQNEKDELVLVQHSFYHDLSNSINLLKGYTDLLAVADESSLPEIVEPVRFLTDKISDEIEVQKKLLWGKENLHQLTWQALHSRDFLQETIKRLFPPDDPRNNHLVIDECSQAVAFISEPAILRRALLNVILNALEANRGEDVVLVGSYEALDAVIFSVHNSQTFPERFREGVFKQRVSEKGNGRGIGLYGTRLLVEKYLRGRILLKSDPGNGTTVMIELPVEPF